MIATTDGSDDIEFIFWMSVLRARQMMWNDFREK